MDGLVGEVSELRVSPDGKRVAAPVPDQFVGDDRCWLAVYWKDMIGLTVELHTDEETVDWRTVYRSRPTTED
jgi:hypothetical protein